jgi:hypothetical protein
MFVRFCSGGPAPVIALTLIFGCSSRMVREGAYPSGQLNYRIETDASGHEQGRETWWYDNGAKEYEALNDHGARNGVFRAWYHNGLPWYQGREDHGVAQDSIVYWHPNGKLKTIAIFKDGISTFVQEFDTFGVALVKPPALETARKLYEDSLQAKGLRKQGIDEWALRMRAMVELYWVLPRDLMKRSYRAVASVRIGRGGNLRDFAWVEKSPSAAFNDIASKALKKVKRFPPFPPAVSDADLEIQYEFVTPGKAPPRRRLMLRDTSSYEVPPSPRDHPLPRPTN